MNQSLAGLRVLDLADRSGALAGRLLADLGAEVVMVEPTGGNSIRHLAPRLQEVAPIEGAFAHQYFSANKQSLVLDLSDADHARTFRAMAAVADVLIDTDAPGYLAELGFDHPQLRADNPGLIQCSITPFGLHSPWCNRTATDIVAGAAGGLIWLSGEPRGTPVQGAADPAYAMAGLVGASSISTAIYQRAHSGAGAGVHIDVSLQEAAAMAAMQTATPSNLTWFGHIPRRPGLSGALKCADGGYVAHLIRPDRFEQFLEWAEHEGIEHGMSADDWQLSRLDAPRKGNPVAATTLALAAKLTRDEFAAGAAEADLICVPVLGFDDHEQTDQYAVNEQFLTLHHAGLGRELGMVLSPVDGMATPIAIRPAPLLGEHQHLAQEWTAAVENPPADQTSSSTSNPATALAGIRVIDFGWVLAAPIGTRILASFGAEVIRVESTTRPDSMRSQIGPDGVPDPDLGGLFNVVNAGKKSLAIDVSTNAGLAVVKELIATADVVVNNFRPGAMERMGLGHDVLTHLKPDIVSLNLPGAHREGPWALRPSMGNTLMAASGFNMLTGFANERPRGIGVAFPDFTGPHLLVTTILAALRERDEHGYGQEIHLTQLSSMVSLLGAEWMAYKATGVQPERRANRDPNYCPHGVFASTGSTDSDDEWIALAIDGDGQWAAFCALMGRPDLAVDVRFANHADRKANEDVLDDIVTAFTNPLDKWDAATLLQDAGIAAAPVEHLADTYGRDPQLRYHYQTVVQPSCPDVEIPVNRECAQWGEAELRLRRAPVVGEHNEHVICELLGHSSDDYVQLVIDNVLG